MSWLRLQRVLRTKLPCGQPLAGSAAVAPAAALPPMDCLPSCSLALFDNGDSVVILVPSTARRTACIRLLVATGGNDCRWYAGMNGLSTALALNVLDLISCVNRSPTRRMCRAEGMLALSACAIIWCSGLPRCRHSEWLSTL